METVPGRSLSAGASATVDTMILSEQILFPVLLTLGLQDCLSLARACCACKAFNEIGSENLIWKAVCEKEWPELGIESIKPLVEVLGGHKKLYWLLHDRHSSFLSAAPVSEPSSWTDAVFCFLLTTNGEAQAFSIVYLSTYKKGLVTNEGHASDVPSVGRLPFSLTGNFQPVAHNDPVESQRNRSPCRGDIFLYKSFGGGHVTSPMWTRRLVGAVVCKKSGRVARLLDQHDIKSEITERDTTNDGRQVVTGIRVPFKPELFERTNSVETRTWFEYHAMGEGFSGAEQVVEEQRLREAAGSCPLDQTSRHVPLVFGEPPEPETRYLPWKSVPGFVLRVAVTGRCETRIAKSGTLAESLAREGFRDHGSGLEQEIVNFEPQRVEFSVSLLTNVPYYASESAGKDPSNFSEAPGRVTFQGVEDCLLALLDWK